MSFQYTQAQLDDIQAALLAQEYPEAYRKAAFFADGGSGVSLEVLAFLNGAADINENNSSYASQFVRNYTQEQYFARYGSLMPTSGPGSLQHTSDEIAKKVIGEILSTRTVPILGNIAGLDALETAQNIFFGQAGGWSGNPLFMGLGLLGPLQSNIISEPENAYDALAMVKFTKGSLYQPSFSHLAEFFEYGAVALWNGGTVTTGFALLGDFLNDAYGPLSTLDLIADGILLGTLVTGDVIHSTEGDDLVHGGLGDDTINGSDGADVLDGGAGADAVNFSGSAEIQVEIRSEPSRLAGFVADVTSSDTTRLYSIETIVATAGDDTFTILDIPDTVTPLTILGGSGKDTLDLSSLESDVLLDAEDGTLATSEGKTLNFFSFETYKGGAGNDEIFLDVLAESVMGGAGDDTIYALSTTVSIDGGAGTDTLSFSMAFPTGASYYFDASSNIEQIFGSTSNDSIANAPFVNGSWGDDQIWGSEGPDTLFGNEDNDTITGGSGGADILVGGLGNDFLVAGPEDVTGWTELHGEEGDDSLVGSADGRVFAWGDEGNDTFGLKFLTFADGGQGNDTYLLEGGENVNITDSSDGNAIRISDQPLTTLAFLAWATPEVSPTGQYTAWLEANTGHNVNLVIDPSDDTVLLEFLPANQSPHSGSYDVVLSFYLFGGSWSDFGISLLNTEPTSDSPDGVPARFLAGPDNVSPNPAPDPDPEPDPDPDPDEPDPDLEGTNGPDSLTGDTESDVFFGGGGDDVLVGGGGDDTFTYSGGTGGFDEIAGGDGRDRLRAISDEAVIGIKSLTGVEVISGGSFTWVSIVAPSTNDTFDFTEVELINIAWIETGAGADTLVGSSAGDLVYGGDGDDHLSGGLGEDWLNGEAGNDTLIGGAGPDRLSGGDGDDILRPDEDDLVVEYSWGGVDTVEASHSRTLSNHVENLTLLGSGDLQGLGNDASNSILGSSGANLLDGAAGADTLDGAAGDDTLQGGQGNDLLYGHDGNDSVLGSEGDDELLGEAGNDSLVGGDGYDTAVFLGNSTDIAFLRQADGSVVATATLGADGRDRLEQVEAVYFLGDATWKSLEQVAGAHGTSASDPWIGGSEYSDQLFGLDGDDILSGFAGNDTIDGGAGSEDVANYNGSGVDFVLTRNADGSVMVQDTLGSEGVDRLVDIEAVYFDGNADWRWLTDLVGDYGTSGNDIWIAGTSGNDNLYGLAGVDILRGYGGNDLLDGGDGDDEASYAGSFSNFTFQLEWDGSVTITDTTGAEGVDRLVGIEALYFEADNAGYLLTDVLQGGGTFI